jgi:hypothetical protein
LSLELEKKIENKIYRQLLWMIIIYNIKEKEILEKIKMKK